MTNNVEEKPSMASVLATAKQDTNIRRGNTLTKLEKLYAEKDPDVLDAVVVARVENHLSFDHIAQMINGLDPSANISEGAIKNYLNKQGVS